MARHCADGDHWRLKALRAPVSPRLAGRLGFPRHQTALASKSRSLFASRIQLMGCRRVWEVLLFNLMVEDRKSEVDDRKLNAVFSALADPTRRAIVRRLAIGEASVGELAKPFTMSFQAVSKHVQVLEHAGLIERSRRAQQRPCRLRPDALGDASGWLGDYRQLWETAFDRLDEHLTKQKGSPK